MKLIRRKNEHRWNRNLWHWEPREDSFSLELSRAELFALRGLATHPYRIASVAVDEQLRDKRMELFEHTDGPQTRQPYVELLDDIWKATNQELRWPRNTIETARPLKSDGPSRAVFNPWD